MSRFWKQRCEDEVERFLRANRPEPREEFVTALLERFAIQRQRSRPQRLGRSVLLAAVVTALAVGAGIAAGGTHVARTSIANLVQVGESGVHGSSDDNGFKGDNGHHDDERDDGNWAGNYETNVPVCHQTSSRTNPWVEIFVSPQGAANHVKHDPPDYIVGAPGSPNTCPPYTRTR
jgi:hypothetical protein